MPIRMLLFIFLMSWALSACGPQPAGSPLEPGEPAVPTDTGLPPTGTPQPPTRTPLPPTPTLTPTPLPDFSQAVVQGAGRLADGRTFIVIDAPGVAGEFVGEVAGLPYPCSFLEDYPDRLLCAGPAVPYGTLFVFDLRLAGHQTVLLSVELSSIATPTPVINYDLGCTIEPLWPMGWGDYGCYAVSCYSYTTGLYVTGSENTCENPFPWWLYMTPSP
jgi:hypothetical protein